MRHHTLFTILLAALPFTSTKDISLQWAICDRSPQETLVKLGLDSSTHPYKESPITYYDEWPPIHLFSGLMFRTKTNKGHPLSTVKVRFREQTSDVPDYVKCGWARYGYNPPTYTCEKRCFLDPTHPGKIWQGEQMQLAQQYGHVNWTALAAYGPYPNAKWKVWIDGYLTKFDDVVTGKLHLMEVEAQVPEAIADQVLEATGRYLRDRGVVLCETQEGKTKRLFRAMGYFDNGNEEL
jgi:hypothetical protein